MSFCTLPIELLQDRDQHLHTTAMPDCTQLLGRSRHGSWSKDKRRKKVKPLSSDLQMSWLKTKHPWPMQCSLQTAPCLPCAPTHTPAHSSPRPCVSALPASSARQTGLHRWHLFTQGQHTAPHTAMFARQTVRQTSCCWGVPRCATNLAVMTFSMKIGLVCQPPLCVLRAKVSFNTHARLNCLALAG